MQTCSCVQEAGRGVARRSAGGSKHADSPKLCLYVHGATNTCNKFKILYRTTRCWNSGHYVSRHPVCRKEHLIMRYPGDAAAQSMQGSRYNAPAASTPPLSRCDACLVQFKEKLLDEKCVSQVQEPQLARPDAGVNSARA